MFINNIELINKLLYNNVYFIKVNNLMSVQNNTKPLDQLLPDHSAQASPERGFEDIFCSAQKCLLESLTVKRRSSLYVNTRLDFTNEPNRELSNRIQNIWENARKALDHDGCNEKETISKALVSIQTLSTELFSIYDHDLNLMREFLPEKQSQVFNQFLIDEFIKDFSYLDMNMAIHSEDGERGAILISYPSKAENIKDFVIKWTDDTEVNSTRVYQNIASKMPGIFAIPDFVQINFEKEQFSPLDNRVENIPKHLLDHLRNSFHQLLEITRDTSEYIEANNEYGESVEQTSTHPSIILSRKVQGEGLFEFISYKYHTLSEDEKQKFFYTLGVVTMLDLILQHEDRIRIIDFEKDTKTYSLATDGPKPDQWGPNFNNLMMSNDRHLHLIDNGLVTENKEEYTQFLKELFSSEDCIDDILTASIKAFESVFGENDPETEDQADTKNRTQLMKDLESAGKASFTEGLKKVFSNREEYETRLKN